MHVVIRNGIFVVGMLSAPPAMAMTKQRLPSPGPQQAQIADPDEQADRLANDIDKANRRRHYDRSSARSIMDFGNRGGGGLQFPH